MQLAGSDVTDDSLHPHGGQTDVELGADGDLSLGGVSQTKQMSHLQLSVGQRYRLVKQLYGSLQVSPLDLDGAKGLVGELTLLIHFQSFGNELDCFRDVP